MHISLLAGLLSHIGPEGREGARREERVRGAPRNAKFAVFPGSALFKKPPRFIMSAELVETSRLWARVNAKIEPEWIEPLAQHLLKRTYSEPHWEKDQAAVMAYEKVTLYGVPLVAHRKVNYGRIDPEVVPRPVHPQRARRGRLAHAPQVLPRQPQTPRRGRGAGAPRPAPRHPRRRRDALRLLRPAGARARRLRRPLRLLVEAQAAATSPTARLRALDAHQRDGAGPSPRTTTRTPGGRGRSSSG